MKTAILALAAIWSAGGAVHDVRQLGAHGDGISKDTAAIQAALDRAAGEGGGTVLLSAGTYLSGTLRLRSHVVLYIASGATLKMSPDPSDFDRYEKLDYTPHSDVETAFFHHALLAGENIENFTLTGEGEIDANRSRRGGPKPIALKLSRHVEIRDITIRNAPNYAVSFLGCDYVVVEGITVLNAYADGIDPDCSRFVRISNCYIDSSDDAIVPKSSFALGYTRVTENITVTNCITRTSANHFKLGTESGGGFRNITVSNMTMYPRPRPAKRDEAGIAVDIVDGGYMDGLTVSNISMHNVRYPLFLRLGTRGTGPHPISYGRLENLSISNVVAAGSDGTATISGLPGHLVRNVMLDNWNVEMTGGVTKPGTLEVPEAPEGYAEPNLFGLRPSYGFYARHVDGLVLRNFQCRWRQRDARPALIFDDVENLELNGFRADTVEAAQPVVWFHQVRDALVTGSRAAAGTGRFLYLSGNQTAGIEVLGNDFRSAALPVAEADDVRRPSYRADSNAVRLQRRRAAPLR